MRDWTFSFKTNIFAANADCGPVPPLDNGAFVLYNVSNTTHGARANVVCHTGHYSSDANITCLAGIWSFADCDPVGKMSSLSNLTLYLNTVTTVIGLERIPGHMTPKIKENTRSIITNTLVIM